MNFWETIKAALRATPPKTDDTCTKFKAKKKKNNNHIMDLCEIINCLEIMFFFTNFERSF